MELNVRQLLPYKYIKHQAPELEIFAFETLGQSCNLENSKMKL